MNKRIWRCLLPGLLLLSLAFAGCAIAPQPPAAPTAVQQPTNTTPNSGAAATPAPTNPAAVTQPDLDPSGSVVGLDGDVIPANPVQNGSATATTSQAGAATRLNVPYMNQLNNQYGPEMSCGPTSLSMVMKYYGKDVSPDQLSTLIGRRPEDGVEMYMLEDAARKSGFPNARNQNQGTMADLERHIANKNPVIVACMNPDGESSHAMVVVGFDQNGNVLINDPYPPDHALTMDRTEFYNSWYNYNQCEYTTLR